MKVSFTNIKSVPNYFEIDFNTRNQIYSDLGNGKISFSVVDGEPYVKVGADAPRPFKRTLKKVVSGKTWGVNSFNIASLLENYNKLSKDDFIISFTGIEAQYGKLNIDSRSFSYNYDSTTGVLTTSMSRSFCSDWTFAASFDVYVIQ